MIEPERTVLWSAASVSPNNTSITLNDSIFNYDEVVYYGSATRSTNLVVSVKTEYPVIPGAILGGGPFYCGCWGSGDNYILNNGTQVFLSGNSGGVYSSYYWGKTHNGTGYVGSLNNNRTNDIRPYKIEGLKYTTADDLTLLWSSNENPYGKSLTLSESVTAFDKIMVYGSGAEYNIYHVSKQVYKSQSGVIGAEPWCYTPWSTGYRCNYAVGCDLKISGTSGYVGSSWFMGIDRTNTAFAAGKWTGSAAPMMMVPYIIYGLNRK